jgi:pyruvate dehydrogenase E1 component alpha subunit
VVVDGNDALAVYTSAVEARMRAVAGEGPTLLEYKTYRWRGHGESDLQVYQPKEEIAAWQAMCPIPKLRSDMLTQGLISMDELRETENQIDAVVKDAIRFAEESPYPDVNEAMEDIFA